eukprot:gene2428-8748_t
MPSVSSAPSLSLKTPSMPSVSSAPSLSLKTPSMPSVSSAALPLSLKNPLMHSSLGAVLSLKTPPCPLSLARLVPQNTLMPLSLAPPPGPQNPSHALCSRRPSDINGLSAISPRFLVAGSRPYVVSAPSVAVSSTSMVGGKPRHASWNCGVSGPSPASGLLTTSKPCRKRLRETVELRDRSRDEATIKSMLLLQTDVTVRAELEKSLADLTEAQCDALGSMFPRHILEHMVSADDPNFNVSTFMDVANFTAMSKEVSPEAVLGYLNTLFTLLDNMVERHGVYKVDTAGDCYIVAGGLMAQGEDGVLALDDNPDPVL